MNINDAPSLLSDFQYGIDQAKTGDKFAEAFLRALFESIAEDASVELIIKLSEALLEIRRDELNELALRN